MWTAQAGRGRGRKRKACGGGSNRARTYVSWAVMDFDALSLEEFQLRCEPGRVEAQHEDRGALRLLVIDRLSHDCETDWLRMHRQI